MQQRALRSHERNARATVVQHLTSNAPVRILLDASPKLTVLNQPVRKLLSRLLLKYSFHLPDFLLHLAAHLLVRSLILEVWIVRGASNLLFNFSLNFVKRSFCLVLAALLHDCLLWPICAANKAYAANKIKESICINPPTPNFSNSAATP